MGRCARMRRRKKRVCGDVNLSADSVNVSLMKWLTNNGWRAERPLKLCSFPNLGGCRGLKCVEAAVPAGGVLVSIPTKLLVTRDLALKSLSSLLEANLSISRWSTQEILAAFLLHERSKLNGFWAPYLQSLPKTYDVPFFCSREEFECFPRYLKSGVMTSRRIVQRAYNKVRSLLSKSVQSFAWAWFAVNTRAVYLPASNMRPEDSMALAPFLDMFNHSFEAVVNAGINVGGGKDFYQIVTVTGIAKSQQAFINYGPHNNLKMLLEYGFVLPGNPNDAVPVDLEELIAGRRRPLPSFKIEILESSGLTNNMGIYATGVSWNVLACLYILGLPEHSLSACNWREVYEVDLEAAIGDKCELKDLLRRKSVELTSSMSSLTALADMSDSAKVALRMITLHHEIIVAAEKSYFNY